MLLKSKTFKEDIKEYHKLFYDDCIKERARKIFSFTSSIRRKMEKTGEDPRELMKYLQSSQCKIPWTYNQIKETQELAQRDLEQLESNVMKEKSQMTEEKISLG